MTSDDDRCDAVNDGALEYGAVRCDLPRGHTGSHQWASPDGNGGVSWSVATATLDMSKSFVASRALPAAGRVAVTVVLCADDLAKLASDGHLLLQGPETEPVSGVWVYADVEPSN